MGVLLLHLALWSFGVFLVGRVIQAWARRPDTDVKCLFLSGGILGALAVGAPLLLLAAGPPPLGFQLRRDVEFWLIWISLAACASFLRRRADRLLAGGQRLHQLRAEAWTQSGDPALEEEDRTIEETRKRMEAKLRRQSGNPRLLLRWSDQIQLPFTTGAVRPEVFAPLWAAYEQDGVHLGLLLAHEKEHIRLGHAAWSTVLHWVRVFVPASEPLTSGLRLGLEVDADRHVMESLKASGEDPAKYLRALRAIIGPAAGSGVEAGLGHDRSNLDLRLRQSVAVPRKHWRYALAAALVLVATLGCHQALGRVDFKTLWNLATLRMQPNYQLAEAHAGVELRSLPGKGGVFLDGIRVNARGVRDGKRSELVLVRGLDRGDRPWTGFRGALHVKVIHRPAHTADLPLLVAEATREGPKMPTGPLGRVELAADTILDFHCLPVAQTGVFTVWASQNKGGPAPAGGDGRAHFLRWYLSIPAGWELEVRDAALEPYSGLRRERSQVAEARRAYWASAPFEAVSQGVPLRWDGSRLYDFSP